MYLCTITSQQKPFMGGPGYEEVTYVIKGETAGAIAAVVADQVKNALDRHARQITLTPVTPYDIIDAEEALSRV